MSHQFDLPTNRLYQIRHDLTRKHLPFVDLVSGNVSAQGISFPANPLRNALAAGLRASRIYHPDPLGQPAARQAIARLYASEGLKIPANQILVTPGTSMSYWYAFKLLADAGDEVLAPVPTYPLFDSIAALCGVKLVPYRLREEKRWEIDFEDLKGAITTRTKAIILISPHNPTGAVATAHEVARLAEISASRNLAIIADEVFSSFVWGHTSFLSLAHRESKLRNEVCPHRYFSRPAGTAAPLVLTMNGISKMLALPGMKIGWMAVTGESARVKKALKTLEMISDTFLPVNEAVQAAVPTLLGKNMGFRKFYAAEIEKRMAAAVDGLTGDPRVSFIRPEGGFFLTLKIEDDEEEIACRLLQKRRILVHPGFFYDLAGQHLVFSFVSRTTVMKKAINSILKEIV